MNVSLTRAEFLRLCAAVGLCAMSPLSLAQGPDASQPMRRRPIPATGEQLPVIGCGTYRGFDIRSQSGKDWEDCAQVLRELFAAGGSVIDSSPMYGEAEATTGALLEKLDAREQAFIATKVWTRDDAAIQMQRSLELLRTDRVDLMQIHNLVEWRTHLPILRQWKEEGRIRYIGITHYTASAYDEVEAILQAEPLDFLQINYSVDERTAEQRLLPLAEERGVAVLINRPFGGGGLLRRLLREPLPEWASDYDCQSWPQLLLKYALSHPAVTCVIPGTGNPRHMLDNLAAGRGREADAAFRERLRAQL